MMDNEDPSRAHKTVPDAPPGAWAISGINSAAFPEQYAAIAAIPQAERGPAVQAFYQREFWNQWLQALSSDDVAKRVFDAAVNMGSGTACKLFQQAVNAVPVPLSGQIAEDGGWGLNTVVAANCCDPVALVAAFKKVRVFHYDTIVHEHPNDARYLTEWVARAEK